MKVLKQSQPVVRKTGAVSVYSNHAVLSDNCGCPNTCVGACVSGKCWGVCA